MNEWKRHERGFHHVGPHWVRVFGDGFVGHAFEEPEVAGRFAWYVTDRQQPGAKTFRQGLAPSVDEAKFAVDAAVLETKRGRGAAVEGELTTSTERNRRRIDRLLASECLARGLINDLMAYQRELVVTGDVKTADRIALSLRRAALSGLADYVRRTANMRGGSGSRMTSPDEMQAHEEAVLRIADELVALADNETAKFDAFETIINKLRKIGAFSDSEFYFAATQSFLLQATT